MKISYTHKPKGIIFDCDGVIIDSFDSNTHFYNSLRRAIGLPDMTDEQRMLVHQMTGAEALQLVIPASLKELAADAYKKIDYVRDITPTLVINEGMVSLLEYCKSQNIPTGIHTNRIIAMQEILEMNNLTQYFSPVMTPAILPAKPDPIGALSICKTWKINPEDALFIGDSDNDRKTALAANIPFLGFKNSEMEVPNKAESFMEVEAWLKSVSE